MVVKTQMIFNGVDNISDPANLPKGKLVSAYNVDFSNSGAMTLRDEAVSVSVHPTHSLVSANGMLYGVQYKQLCIFDSSFNATPLMTLNSNNRMSYALCPNGYLVFSNGTDIGYLFGNTANYFPTPETTELVSLTNETIDLQKITLPAGQYVEYFSGRIFTASYSKEANGCLISYTDASEFHVNDVENFLYAFGKPTLLMATDDTLWFSNGITITAYIGTDYDEAPQEVTKTSFGAIADTAVSLDATELSLENVTGKVIIVTTARGICALLNGGQIINLSKSSYSVPQAESGAAGIIESKGYKRYITCLKSIRTAHNQY